MSLIPRISLRPLAFVTALSGLAACVDNNADAGLVILRNLLPAEGCLPDVETEQFVFRGVIESRSHSGYLLAPLVRNDLVVAEGESMLPKMVFLEGARVKISFYDTALFSATEVASLKEQGLTEFVVPLSGSIDPNGGLNEIIFEVVPRELLLAIGQVLPAGSEVSPTPTTVVDVRLQMYGQRSGGDIESNWFRFPVEVCNDCLTVDRGACASLPESFEPRTGGRCNPSQDGVVDCCDNGMVCPATAPPEPI